VRASYDALGCLGTAPDSWFTPLRKAGAEVLEYHPLAPWLPHWGFNRRNHQKILVVDGDVGFTGGLNLGNEYAPAPEGGGWMDLHARVDGQAARELAQVFARAWRSGGGAPFEPVEPSGPPALERDQGCLVQTIDNEGLRRRHAMRAAWRHAIARAQRSIVIANSYFIPDRVLRTAFRAATLRGANVRVLLPSHSDVAIVQMAARHLYRRLLRQGVRIFEHPGPMMHAKAAVIDGVWSTLGSFNLDRRSFLHNLEVGLVVADAPFGAELQDAIVQELELSKEITLEDVLARGPVERLLGALAYSLRYWL
jgi:cardiolipin synthase